MKFSWFWAPKWDAWLIGSFQVVHHFMHFHKAIVDGNPILVWKQISIGHVDMLCYLLIRAFQFPLNKNKKIYLSMKKKRIWIWFSGAPLLINNMCTSTVGCCPTGAEFLGGYSSHPEAAQQRPPSWQLVSDFFFLSHPVPDIPLF